MEKVNSQPRNNVKVSKLMKLKLIIFKFHFRLQRTLKYFEADIDVWERDGSANGDQQAAERGEEGDRCW